MRRIIITTLVALAGVGYVAPAPASANPPPSIQYCSGYLDNNPNWNGSLRGGGSLAPDNDVRRFWDLLQRNGWNVTRTTFEGYYSTSHTLNVKIAFYDPYGFIQNQWFSCYDNRNHGGGSDNLYHDN